MKIVRSIAVFTILLLFFSGISVSAVTKTALKQAGETKQFFDENNITARFAIISDTHITNESNQTAQKLNSALEQLNAKASGRLNALVVAGDMTDYGKTAHVKAFKTIVSAKIDFNKTRLILAMGNHDYFDHVMNNARLYGSTLFNKYFGSVLYPGEGARAIKRGNYHTTVNGFHFIAINCESYEAGAKYCPADLTWLKRQLALAAKDNPHKPIFVVSHPMIEGTTWGSNLGNYWASDALLPLLNQYPQVIYFAGHLHYPLNDEREIWQGSFTAVGTGSVFGCCLDEFWNGTKFLSMKGDTPADFYKFSQGLYVEIDGQNDVRITRMDFYHRQDIKSPWIIPSPKADSSHLRFYGEASKLLNCAPEFPKGSSVNVVRFSGNPSEITVKFRQARDDDMTVGYFVTFTDPATGKDIKTIPVYSDFYRVPEVSQMSAESEITLRKEDLLPLTFNMNKDYIIKVTAFDSYGSCSAPIYGKTNAVL